MLHTHYVHAHKQLGTYYTQWNRAFQKKDIHHKQFGEYVRLFQEYAIPYEYSTSFFQSMVRDCIVDRYQTYEELEKYMYGSAAVIGLMMCCII
jgi:phytoene synthase